MISFIKRLVKTLLAKCRFGRRCLFGFSTYVSLDSYFEGANKIGEYTIFEGNMGYGSYIGPNCRIRADIGRFTSIAPNVKTNSGVHPYLLPYVTTSPMFYSTKKQSGKTFATCMKFQEITSKTTIGNDCWIGENVFIAGGLTISDGSVLLTGAVVVDDVPPYSVVGGVPAKVLRYRYDNDTIDFLLRTKWWNRDLDWLKNNWTLMSDMESLKKFIQ